MDFVAFHFQVEGADRELLLAHLEEFPFNGFEERPETLVAYLPAAADHPALREHLHQLTVSLDISWEESSIKDQNWNARWEAAFEPIRVGDFVGVRAEFHPHFDGVAHELLIHPRMAFGTGHHATTYLMMERMATLNWENTSVFDFGCGTGILAILAKKLGAGRVDAVDIEAPAYENTLVNMAANATTAIQVYLGDLDAVPPTQYDHILANINRNVILATLPALYERLLSGGNLLVSGILQEDTQLVLHRGQETGFSLIDTQERQGWMMIHFQRTTA